MKPINVLSLFDGISCGRVALERLGIPINNYFASEIDKYAIKIALKNYPNIIQIGDITKVDYNNGYLIWEDGKYDKYVGNIDLIFGGSPCQGFSFAGKQLNFNDPRSKLFFEFVRLLKEINPKYFLLENVRMKKEYKDVISKEVGVEPVLINSALVSAQNRQRLYWTNIQGTTQPEDKNIYLKDIIEQEVDEKYYLNEQRKNFILHRPKNFECKINPNKTNTLRTNYGNSSANETYIYQLPHGVNLGGIKAKNGKVPSMTKSQWEHNNLLIQRGFINKNQQGNRVYDIKGKSSTLSALGGGWGAKTGLYEIEDSIRKLTPIECERLQTLPDNYTSEISDSQRYKCLGNGWTIDIIKHILSFAKFN